MRSNLISIAEAARRLGLKPATLRRRVHAGRFPASFIPGGPPKIRTSTIDKILRDDADPSKPASPTVGGGSFHDTRETADNNTGEHNG